MNATSRRLDAVRSADFLRMRNSIVASLLAMMMALGAVLPVEAQDVQLVLNPYDGIDWQSVTHHKGKARWTRTCICGTPVPRSRCPTPC